MTTQDHTVHPDLQRWVSKRMGATVVEVESSHVPMLSKPDVVLEVIRKAAKAVRANTTTQSGCEFRSSTDRREAVCHISP